MRRHLIRPLACVLLGLVYCACKDQAVETTLIPDRSVQTGGESVVARVDASVLTKPSVDSEPVGNHQSDDLVFAAPDWSLEQAAAMVRGRFRHLVVVDRGEPSGIISVRDIVRCWTDDGAICEVPASAGYGAAA